MQAAGQQVGQVFPQAGAFYMQPLTQVMRLGIMQVNNRLSCLDIVEMVIWRGAWNKDLSDVSYNQIQDNWKTKEMSEVTGFFFSFFFFSFSCTLAFDSCINFSKA